MSQPVPRASCRHPPNWAMSGVSKHRRWGRIAGCGWGVWGPVPHGHSSEWEIFSVWRWERSSQRPVLSLEIVTWAALPSWWMLSFSVPRSRWSEVMIVMVVMIVIPVKGAVPDCLQSPHWAANCLQHKHSSGRDTIVCKSHAPHQVLIACNFSCATWYEGTAQLFSLTEFKLHLV